MAKTNIEWCDYTYNPWRGCSKVSPGCLHCYAEARAKRWGEDFKKRIRASEPTLAQPLKWNEAALRERATDAVMKGVIADAHPIPFAKIDAAFPCRRPRVFCGSLMDWLDPEVPAEWLADLLAMIHRCQNLDWLLLTKRPELWESRLSACYTYKQPSEAVNLIAEWVSGKAHPNIWLGATVENQEMADKRIPELLKIPAQMRFLSCEPLLSGIKFRRADGVPANWIGALNPISGIHWAIVGGESGPKRRPMELEWMGGIIDQCKAAGVPVFVKQDTAFKPGMQGRIPDEWWQLKELPQ